MALTADAHPAKFLQQYSKQYYAGAFATPTEKELRDDPLLVDHTTPAGRTVAVRKVLTRESIRRDFTGARYSIPAGTLVITHVARTPGAPLDRDVADAAFVTTYAEDHELRAQMIDSGRHPYAHRVSAAAEVLTVWGPPGQPPVHLPGWDAATVTPIADVRPPESLRARMVAEVDRIARWDDDFPYYSDGSWTSVSLRGYWPLDPTRGVKPSEMPKSWKAEHPHDLDRTCEWTTLAREVPLLRKFVESVAWWKQTQRVRLLRMDAGGKLGRHSDISDRDGGTRNGQIVRFHIPLRTAPGALLHTWNLDGSHTTTHLAEWGCYYLDARKPHAVVNDTTVNRVHLVVDVVADAAVRRHIADAHAATIGVPA